MRAVLGMIAGEQQPTAAVAAAGKLVDPGDRIFIGLIGGLGQAEEFAKVAKRRRLLDDVE